VALLPDCEIATVETWLADHQDINVLSRDRGGGLWRSNVEGPATCAPGRRPLASHGKRERRFSRCGAEKLQFEGYVRHEEANAVILALAGQGVAIKEIVRRTAHSRKLVRQVIRGERTDVFRVRQSSLEAYLPLLDELWSSDCRRPSP
jgi:hypothetical protein